MDEILRRFGELRSFSLETFISLVDIALVAYVIYRLLVMVRSTRAWRIVGGIVFFIAALFLSDYLKLKTLHWILDRATTLAPVALVILLLPELRQTLEGFARLGLWPDRLPGLQVRTDARTIEEILAAIAEMSAARVGAIIVVERGMQLNDVAGNGVQLGATVSAPLIGSIFYDGNPLHDGALVVRGDVMVAAACQLPLSENTQLAQNMHMRHRAGLGIAEMTDCVVLIVSEERGTVSTAIDGKLTRMADLDQLRELMNSELRGVTAAEKKKKNGRSRQAVGR